MPEHISSTVAKLDAVAWLVDGFGQAHALAAKSLIGRSNEGVGLIKVVVKGVSNEHAKLQQSSDGWTVRDVSKNGTLVNGIKVPGRCSLPTRSVITVGPVPMWFVTELADAPTDPPTQETIELRNGAFAYHLVPATGPQLRLSGDHKGGTLSRRADDSQPWSVEHDLPTLEYELLRTLAIAAYAQPGGRGCVPSAQLAAELSFNTDYPNGENVRQLVHRHRTTLLEMGVTEVIDVQPGRGYYLACPVTVVGA